MPTIRDNLRRIEERISAAARAAKRDPTDIQLVVVTKNRTAMEIQEAAAAGAVICGENRVQEAESKIPLLADYPITWHFIGHLQTNKAARAAELFAMVQSVDSRRLADALEKRAAVIGKRLPVLIEVNTSGEDTKFGVAAAEVGDLVGYTHTLPHVAAAGLMTVGPLHGGRAAAARSFNELRRLFEEVKPAAGATFTVLSMGMTEDFEVAIAEGSTMVRMGRAVFDAS